MTFDFGSDFEEWGTAYKEKEQIRLANLHAAHLLELAFYQQWRKLNPRARWQPKLWDDEI